MGDRDMGINEGASLRYLSTMRTCKNQLDILGERFLQNVPQSSRQMRSQELSENASGPVMVIPTLSGWRTVIVDESDFVGYIGLDLPACFTFKVSLGVSYEDYLIATGWWRERTKYLLGLDNSIAYTDQQVKDAFAVRERDVESVQKTIMDRVEFRINPTAKKLAKGNPKYLPMIRLDFWRGEKNVISSDRRGVYTSSGITGSTDWRSFVRDSFAYLLSSRGYFPWHMVQYRIGNSDWFSM